MQNNGIHIIADLINCNCDLTCLVDSEKFKEFLLFLIKGTGLSAIDSCLHSFGENEGFTCIVLLAESHISIHTWPNLNEKKIRNKVNLDIFVCNYTSDNTDKARKIYKTIIKLLNPEKNYSHSIIRK